MKITIQVEDEAGINVPLTLCDDGYDVPGFFDLFIKDGEQFAVHINNLLPAIAAFEKKYLQEKRA